VLYLARLFTDWRSFGAGSWASDLQGLSNTEDKQGSAVADKPAATQRTCCKQVKCDKPATVKSGQFAATAPEFNLPHLHLALLFGGGGDSA